MNVGWTYFAAGMVSRGVAAGREDDRERSGFLRRLLAAGRHSSERGEFQAAVGQLRSAVSLGGHQVVVADLASACSLAGATGEATAILDRLVELRRQHYVPAICLARVYSRLGDTATAIEWLEAAFAERNGEMVFLERRNRRRRRRRSAAPPGRRTESHERCCGSMSLP